MSKSSKLKRTFHSIEFSDEAEKENFCKWLKSNDYYYEASGCNGGYHVEVKCTKIEAEIINGKLDEIIR